MHQVLRPSRCEVLARTVAEARENVGRAAVSDLTWTVVQSLWRGCPVAAIPRIRGWPPPFVRGGVRSFRAPPAGRRRATHGPLPPARDRSAPCRPGPAPLPERLPLS